MQASTTSHEGELIPRRLVITMGHVVERKSGCYSLVEGRALTGVAALVRFGAVRGVAWRGQEWMDAHLLYDHQLYTSSSGRPVDIHFSSSA